MQHQQHQQPLHQLPVQLQLHALARPPPLHLHVHHRQHSHHVHHHVHHQAPPTRHKAPNRNPPFATASHPFHHLYSPSPIHIHIHIHHHRRCCQDLYRAHPLGHGGRVVHRTHTPPVRPLAVAHRVQPVSLSLMMLLILMHPDHPHLPHLLRHHRHHQVRFDTLHLSLPFPNRAHHRSILAFIAWAIA